MSFILEKEIWSRPLLMRSKMTADRDRVDGSATQAVLPSVT